MPDHEIDYQLIARQSTDTRGKRLREVAYQAIKDSILLGIVGTRSPLAEERLAEVLQISRTPVREALALLEHEGLLEALPYKGLYVRAISLTEFLEMVDTIELIEPALARRAAARASAADIEAMEQSLRTAETCIPAEPGRHFLACRDFQQQMGISAGLHHLTRLLLSIEERSDLYLIYAGAALPETNMQAAVEDRRRILTAVKQGNPAEAEQAAREHAQRVRQRWHAFFK